MPRSFFLHALSVSVYVLQVRRFPECSRVKDEMTADAGAGVGIVTVGPGFVGTTNTVADSKSYTERGAVRARCPSVLHPRLEFTEAEHELRYVFNLVRYSRFGAP